AAQARLASPAWRDQIERLRAAPRLEPQAIAAALGEILEPLYAVFAGEGGSRGGERHRAVGDYRRAPGPQPRRLAAVLPPADNFAAFLALADNFERGGRGRDWRRWPAPYQRADSPAVAEFAAHHRAVVERHAWTQFELDRQLGLVAQVARSAGLSLGLYTDLA